MKRILYSVAALGMMLGATTAHAEGCGDITLGDSPLGGLRATVTLPAR